MRIRVLTAKPGFPAGKIVDMEPAEAHGWLSSGDGEKVDAKAGAATAETAAGKQGAETR